jgi:chemotaxis protein methyltransferase WspC
MDTCTAVEKLLEERMGLIPGISVGRAGLERVFAAAMGQAGVADRVAYLELLKTSPTEVMRLVEKLVVHETWFFRDQEPFRYLERVARERLSAKAACQIRILSAPCSTGEEPYSIAVALLAAGIKPEQFFIDAADISAEGLAAAARAVYGRASFRQPIAPERLRFFGGVGEEKTLDENVVRCVHFQRANLADPLFLADKRPYDIIFCRNILIYLTEEARSRVFGAIDRLLAPDGIFFTGHAEMGLLRKHGYRAVGHARSFACVRGGKERIAEKTAPLRSASVKPHALRPVVDAMGGAIAPEPGRETGRSGHADAATEASGATGADALRAKAKALADGGLFGEAAELCGRYLQEQSPHADIYCLLGIIREAERCFEDAEGCYEKALYLDPGHYETLVHLSLFYRQRGEPARAERCRQRAQTTEGRMHAAVAS